MNKLFTIEMADDEYLIPTIDYDDDSDVLMPGETCMCYDCETYINQDTIRPIKGQDTTDEEFNEMLELCAKDTVIQMMKRERYRSYVYEVVPYPKWSSLLKDPEKYQAIVDELESKNVIPNDDPEICRIGHGMNDDGEIMSISYRFPSSTVKYDLTVFKDGDRIKLKTHGRGGSELNSSE